MGARRRLLSPRVELSLLLLGGHLSRQGQLQDEGLLARPDLANPVCHRSDLGVKGLVGIGSGPRPLSAHARLLDRGHAQRLGEPRQELGLAHLTILRLGRVVEVLRHVEGLTGSCGEEVKQALVTDTTLFVGSGSEPAERVPRIACRLCCAIGGLLGPSSGMRGHPLGLSRNGILPGVQADRALQRGEFGGRPRILPLEGGDPVVDG